MLQPHLRINNGDISRNCIIAGEPERVLRIASMLKDSKKVSDNRGYVVYNGSYEGIPLTIACTGIGGPSAAIALEELINAGAKTIIRVGSGALLRKEMNTGDAVISTGVCKEEKGTLAYAPEGFAAVPDYEVLNALIESAKESGRKFFYGVTMCTDGFYAPSHRGKMLEWAKMGVIGSDMESSMLFTIASLRGVRAGFIYYGGLNILKKQTHKDILKQEKERRMGESGVVLIALNAFRKLERR